MALFKSTVALLLWFATLLPCVHEMFVHHDEPIAVCAQADCTPHPPVHDDCRVCLEVPCGDVGAWSSTETSVWRVLPACRSGIIEVFSPAGTTVHLRRCDHPVSGILPSLASIQLLI
ncbi:MAG TPA: hypothetical protein PJ991_04635 [Kiritimatiellia bacterium]|nr:hypothetical protein [Kiritimatiellia bacterium]